MSKTQPTALLTEGQSIHFRARTGYASVAAVNVKTASANGVNYYKFDLVTVAGTPFISDIIADERAVQMLLKESETVDNLNFE